MLVAALVISTLIALILPLWRRDRVVRFWTTGCLLATLLMCTTFPHDRLLTGLGVGGMALVAEILASVAQGSYRERGRWVSVAAGVLIAVHLVIAPLLSPYRARAMNDVNRMLGRANASVPSDASVTTKSVVIVNPPLDPFAGYFLMYRTVAGERRPRHLRWFATGVTDLRIERVDDRTLRIRPGAGFLSSTSQMMLRSLTNPFRLGDRIALSDVVIEVSDVAPDGRPLEILVRFTVRLEDPSLDWLKWEGHGYVPFQLPKVGETVVLPAANMREVLFG
jgi:MFS family permease